jgi:hypothetical protein
MMRQAFSPFAQCSHALPNLSRPCWSAGASMGFPLLSNSSDNQYLAVRSWRPSGIRCSRGPCSHDLAWALNIHQSHPCGSHGFTLSGNLDNGQASSTILQTTIVVSPAQWGPRSCSQEWYKDIRPQRVTATTEVRVGLHNSVYSTTAAARCDGQSCKIRQPRACAQPRPVRLYCLDQLQSTPNQRRPSPM